MLRMDILRKHNFLKNPFISTILLYNQILSSTPSSDVKILSGYLTTQLQGIARCHRLDTTLHTPLLIQTDQTKMLHAKPNDDTINKDVNEMLLNRVIEPTVYGADLY